MEYRQIEVYGKVQGVFFRKSTQEKALELKIAGDVKNRADGSVEIHAAGAADAMQKFLEWCAQGPPRAEVEDMKITPVHAFAASGFQIVHH